MSHGIVLNFLFYFSYVMQGPFVFSYNEVSGRYVDGWEEGRQCVLFCKFTLVEMSSNLLQSSLNVVYV